MLVIRIHFKPNRLIQRHCECCKLGKILLGPSLVNDLEARAAALWGPFMPQLCIAGLLVILPPPCPQERLSDGIQSDRTNVSFRVGVCIDIFLYIRIFLRCGFLIMCGITKGFLKNRFKKLIFKFYIIKKENT